MTSHGLTYGHLPMSQVGHLLIIGRFVQLRVLFIEVQMPKTLDTLCDV